MRPRRPGGEIPVLGAAGRPQPGHCRFCGAPLEHTFLDLGMSPLCESYVSADQLASPETYYPLHVYVCGRCFLVQLEEFVSGDIIFSDYAYFSSYSDSWLEHARRYVAMVTDRFSLGPSSSVIEVASNDGYLLQYFVQRGIPCIGIEPAANVAAAAEARRVPTLVRFFGRTLARELADGGGRADLIVGNNVLAQVHDINDFVAGLAIALAPTGVLTLEFPHLVRLVERNQFDTIYHEHFSYFSFLTAEAIFAAHGIRLFDVEELPTHGGSLRVFGCLESCQAHARTARADRLHQREIDMGVTQLPYYGTFIEQAREAKRKLLTFLIGARREGRTVAGYGAPGKGNTLLNYCGIGTDLIDFTVDRNPHKQGKYLPGSRIPIHPPTAIDERRPDYVLILPWNLKDEIMAQMAHIRTWGGRFVVAIPEVVVYD